MPQLCILVLLVMEEKKFKDIKLKIFDGIY